MANLDMLTDASDEDRIRKSRATRHKKNANDEVTETPAKKSKLVINSSEEEEEESDDGKDESEENHKDKSLETAKNEREILRTKEKSKNLVPPSTLNVVKTINLTLPGKVSKQSILRYLSP